MGTGISKARTPMAMIRSAFSRELVIDRERALTAITLSGDDAEIITVPVAKRAHN
jgi:hypothetical protein